MAGQTASTWRSLRGTIAFPDDATTTIAAVAVVRLCDVSRADAATELIAEDRILQVPVRPRGGCDFQIKVPVGRIDERNRYAIEVHVDLNGSGAVRGGDLITTRSYPVLTHGYPDDVAVQVERVDGDG